MEAKHLFENFKKRYQKKKATLKKSNQSGMGAAVKEKAEKDFEPYRFFSWYDEYTRCRATKDNISSPIPSNTASNDTNNGDGNGEDENDENKVDENNDKDDNYLADIWQSFSQETEVSKRKGSKRKVSQASVIDNNDQLLKDVGEIIKKRHTSGSKKDPEDLYGLTIAAELRKFPPKLRCMVKHEFGQILFKYQITMHNPSTPLLSPASPVNSFTSMLSGFPPMGSSNLNEGFSSPNSSVISNFDQQGV